MCIPSTRSSLQAGFRRRILAALGLLAAAAPLLAPGKAVAQRQQSAPLSAEQRQTAEQLAGALRLTSADGERRCDLTLTTQPAGPGLALTLDRVACGPIAFIVQASAWKPEGPDSIRILDAQGRTLAEFTEATEGSFEALREGDGVYFLGPPAVLDRVGVTPEDLVGEWVLTRQGGAVACRWTFTDIPASQGGFAIDLGRTCDATLTQFAPASWELSGGNILVRSALDKSMIRFARQDDGSWARTPERNRPLVMTRP